MATKSIYKLNDQRITSDSIVHKSNSTYTNLKSVLDLLLTLYEFDIQYGTIGLVTAAANGYTDTKLTYQRAFKEIPIILLTVRGGATSTDNGSTMAAIVDGALGKTTTNATVRFYNKSSTARSMYIDYIAIGKRK